MKPPTLGVNTMTIDTNTAAIVFVWTSADGQREIGAFATEAEAWAECLDQCGSDEDRAEVLAGGVAPCDCWED